MSADVPEAGRAAVADRVSRETLERLDLLAALLVKWQRTINLVAPATLPALWTRHVADSLQLLDHAPAEAAKWVDLGSGGGFPGLVVAAARAGSGIRVHLVESDQRKAAFLREAARQAALPVEVTCARIEAAAPALAPGTQVVSARALAPLPKLLDLAAPFLDFGALGLFLKGKDASQELTRARKGWTLDSALHQSATDPEARVLVVRSARPMQPVESPAARLRSGAAARHRGTERG